MKVKPVSMTLSLVFLALIIVGCAEDAKKNGISPEKNQGSLRTTVENDSIQIQVSGILICTHCYSLNELNVGLDHQLPKSGFVKDCARLCSQQNYPIGVLSETKQHGSTVWVIRTSSQLFTDYMSNEAVIKGVFVKDGLIEPTQIRVREGKDWLRIQ